MKDLDKVYDLLEKMYMEFTQKFEDMSNQLRKTDSRVDSIEGRLDNIEGKVDSIEGRLDNLEGKVNCIEGRLDNIEGGVQGLKNLITEVDKKNDARYTALSSKIDEQGKSFQTMEIVTASNYADIARLKSAK